MKVATSVTPGPPAELGERAAPLPHHRPRTRAQKRERLNAYFRQHPPVKIDPEELEAHFEGMPKRYWDTVTKNELVWGLETVHAFFGALAAADFPGTPVVADWRHCPERGFTKVMVSTWDRPGLLAKVAAAFSALRINILRADVFTRADNVVLDVFRVPDLGPAPVEGAAVLDRLKFLLEGALREPPRLVWVWASEFHKTLDKPRAPRPRLSFDLAESEDYTVLRVQAADRVGLLCDLVQCLTACEVSIAQAVINTEGGVARDVFYVTDLEEEKITDPARLEAIQAALARAV